MYTIRWWMADSKWVWGQSWFQSQKVSFKVKEVKQVSLQNLVHWVSFFSIKCMGRPLRVYVNSGELKGTGPMTPQKPKKNFTTHVRTPTTIPINVRIFKSEMKEEFQIVSPFRLPLLLDLEISAAQCMLQPHLNTCQMHPPFHHTWTWWWAMVTTHKDQFLSIK